MHKDKVRLRITIDAGKSQDPLCHGAYDGGETRLQDKIKDYRYGKSLASILVTVATQMKLHFEVKRKKVMTMATS